jgi:hypothetical protein
MKIYLSGPITGHESTYKAEFEEAERQLYELGYHNRISPASLPDLGTWEANMKRDIKLLMDCDGVALLDGWNISRGAQLEMFIAKYLNMDVRLLADWL